MPTEKMKAYHVGEGSEGEHVITFATNSARARREAGNELDLTFEEVDFCRRAPWADQFAGQRFIPAKAYHEQGWWLYCNNCENQLYEDKEIADANTKVEAFNAKVLAERPDLTFTEWSIGWPRILCRPSSSSLARSMAGL